MVPGVYAKESEVRMGGVFSGFIASVQDLFAGDAPFLEGLGNVFKDGLGGFGTLFTDLLGGLFGEGGGMGFLSGLFGFGARSGGIMTPSGKVSGYSTGGVARGPGAGYPALLHGTEAVVPLPNGRSIPVEMQNGGGQTQNNVVVNVSADGSARTSESSGPDMDNLGAAIARAVQQELQAQKRSGGILNPYGVA